MSKRTTILILILAVLTAGLLYLALMGTSSKKSAQLSPTPTPVSPNAKTTLSLENAPTDLLAPGSQHTVAVVVDSSNLVNGVQIELGYDPITVTNVSVVPGPFFKQPAALIKNIDTLDGRLSYALIEQSASKEDTGKGIVALVSFDINTDVTQKETTFVFMPKTAVTSKGILESVLKKTVNYTLNITPAPAQPASTSAH